jgi:TetR/AcrR family transcriptional repressor of nem operon
MVIILVDDDRNLYVANLGYSDMLVKQSTAEQPMARSQAEKAQSRTRILKIAGAELRVRGLDGIGVADLMSAAGMTHGGFYNHFESREKLVEATLEQVLAEAEAQKEATHGKGRSGLLQYIGWYLSQAHRDGAASGCPVASLVNDVSRAGDGARSVFTAGVGRFIEWISDLLGSRRERPEERAILIVSAIVGAVALARAVNDPEMSERILGGVRKQLRAIT